MAIHFALAFVHYEEFGFDNKLFKEFLGKASAKQLSEFISFLGRSYIAGENCSVLKGEKFRWRIKRIKDFWEWVLKNKGDSLSLKEFGSWIKTDCGVFEIKWLAEKINQTLKATGGKLEWNYGLIKSIEKLARKVPETTLQILKKCSLASVSGDKIFFVVREDREWYNAFKIL